MNTLTGIEAERVNQILKYAIDRLVVLSYVPLMWSDDIVVDITCQPVLNSLERLWIAEEQLKDLAGNSTSGASTEGGNNMLNVSSGGKDIMIIKQMHRAARAACRNLTADRESLQVIMSRPESQCEDFVKFIKYLSELKSQVLQRLTTTVEDEAANRATLHELTEREQHFEESRSVLQSKLNELRTEKEQVSLGLDLTLRKLQAELAEITQHNKVEIDSVQKEMNEAISKATADHELRMRQLQDSVDALERQVSEVVEKNREEEQRLRKDKTRMESTLNATIAKYDEDMASRTKTLQDLKMWYENEAREYAELKEHFDKIDADITRSVEEQSILRAVARREEFGNYILFMAAANIQKLFRGRQAREAVAKLKAKAKKGKKGKKGKK